MKKILLWVVICLIYWIFTWKIFAAFWDATITSIIDWNPQTSWYTTPARIYHIHTGLNIKITALKNLDFPIAALAFTGVFNNTGDVSITYKVRFDSLIYSTNPLTKIKIDYVNSLVANYDNHPVAQFEDEINPLLKDIIPRRTIANIYITARSKVTWSGTIIYNLYDSGMNLLAATWSINLEFTRPSLTLSWTDPTYYEYNSWINPNLDVNIIETGLYPNLTPIGIDINKLSVSLNSWTSTSLTWLYNTIPTLWLWVYNITYHYTGADADTVALANTVSWTYVHAVPLTRQLIVQDTTAPTIDILWPISGTSITDGNSITLTFTGTDNNIASWIQFECKINSWVWTNCSSPMTYAGLINGNYVINLRGTDISWNTSNEKNVSFTINYSTSSIPPSWWGGWGQLIKDNCPDGDYSYSYYDKICWTKPTNATWAVDIIFSDSDVYNDTVHNGYCYERGENISIIDSRTISTTQEFKKALTFLYAHDMTMFRAIDDFDPYRTLTREEAAKIFTNFAMNVLCRKTDTNLQISYNDIKNSDSTLQSYITLAYQLWLMKWWTDGNFRPFDKITKAEFNAVLVRMILKSYLPEDTGDTWYSEYNKVSTTLGIIKYGANNTSLSRNNAALMLFRAYKKQIFSLQNIDYESFVLDTRDKFIN